MELTGHGVDYLIDLTGQPSMLLRLRDHRAGVRRLERRPNHQNDSAYRESLYVPRMCWSKGASMSTPRDVAVLVGSLRKDSLNRKVALALAAMAPAGLKLDLVEIGQLPLYNQDLDVEPPAS
jgi:hypothetical protein